MKDKVFIATTPEIFQRLVGYVVGDVEINRDSVVIRFDKQIDNVLISREVMLSDEVIYVTEDYVLDITHLESEVPEFE